MSRTDTDTRPAFSITGESRVKLPLALLASAGLAIAAGTTAWITLRSDVAQHAHQIAALQIEMRSNRELLVRIDENVKALKEHRK